MVKEWKEQIPNVLDAFDALISKSIVFLALIGHYSN